MKIMMKKTMDDDVLKYGCNLSIEKPKNLNGINVFMVKYKQLIRKPMMAILILFLAFFSILVSVLISNKQEPILLIIIGVLSYFLAFSLPFIIRIKSIKRVYKLTNSLYELLKNNNNLVLDLEEFEIKLCQNDEIFRKMFYSSLRKIEIYENIIVFRCEKKKNNFFISSEYKEQLIEILNAMALSKLVEFKKNNGGSVSI